MPLGFEERWRKDAATVRPRPRHHILFPRIALPIAKRSPLATSLNGSLAPLFRSAIRAARFGDEFGRSNSARQNAAVQEHRRAAQVQAYPCSRLRLAAGSNGIMNINRRATESEHRSLADPSSHRPGARSEHGRIKPIPRDPSFDNTLALLREGYDFISTRCDRLNTDIFATRLMLRPAICVRGAEAAEMFYGSGRFTRKGAMPQTTLRLLQDKGSVQSLDGAAHRQRKAMFLSILLDEEQIESLRDHFRRAWRDALHGWEQRDEIILFEAANLVLTRAVADWLGIPGDKDRTELCRELSGMIENAGGFGPSTWLALWRRRRTEKYARGLVAHIRSGAVSLPPGNPLRVISEHVDADGTRVDASSAAVEIINLMRPVVAVGRYIMFAAMALDENPEWRQHFAAGNDAGLEAFAEEVRRFYPFFPFVGGRVLEAFDWKDHRFHRGDWVLLDLYGSNHDEHRFPQPQRFDPGRGSSWKSQGYDFIPQGAGRVEVTHRCPGEAVTVALIMDAIRLLTRSMTYDVPAQDLAISKARIPARPSSGFAIINVRKTVGRGR